MRLSIKNQNEEHNEWVIDLLYLRKLAKKYKFKKNDTGNNYS